MSLEEDSSKTNEIEDKSMKVPAKPNFPQKRKRRPRPKDYPKRPLSAYNIFFKETREEIIANAKDQTHPIFKIWQGKLLQDGKISGKRKRSA